MISELQTLLQAAIDSNNLRLYRVSQGLLWVASGFSIKVVAELLKVSIRTPYNWLKALMSGGIQRILADCPTSGRGRKPKLTKPQQAELKQRVLDGPEANGFDSDVWNTAMINELCLRQFGVSFNPHYLAALLKKLGLSYQKAGFITDRVDEETYEAQRKQWVTETWPAILARAKANNAIILFGDEVSFAMWGSLSKTWAARGEQPLVKTKGIRKGLKMYGVIEFAGGGFHYMESLHYTLKPKSLRELKLAGLPSHLHALLKPLKDEEFKTRDSFTQRLEDILGKENIQLHQALILKHTEKENWSSNACPPSRQTSTPSKSSGKTPKTQLPT